MPLEPVEPPAIPAPEAPAVNPEELLMRGVLSQQYKLRQQVPLQQGAFLPKKNDITGLSLSRRQSVAHPDFLTPQQLKGRCRAQTAETSGVVQLIARHVESLGIRIRPDPVEANAEAGDLADPGHALLPDINITDWADDAARERMRLWASQLIPFVEVVIEPG